MAVKKSKPKRRYTDDERAAALAALAANGGNVFRTAAQLGIPATTIKNWAKGYRHPEAAEMGEQKKGPMADALEAVAWKLLDSIPSKIAKATLAQVSTSMGISIDKARLLRGEPTNIEESRNDDRLAEFRKRYLAAQSTDDAGEPVSRDGIREPVHPAPADSQTA